MTVGLEVLRQIAESFESIDGSIDKVTIFLFIAAGLFAFIKLIITTFFSD